VVIADTKNRCGIVAGSAKRLADGEVLAEQPAAEIAAARTLNGKEQIVCATKNCAGTAGTADGPGLTIETTQDEIPIMIGAKRVGDVEIGA
jgi:hypothetical protein